MVCADPLYSHSKLLGGCPAAQVSLAKLAGSSSLCSVMIYHLLGDGQPVQVHELRQVTQMLHILDLLTKFHTDDWFEEVVHNTDEMCWMNYETGFQVLLIAPINNL